MWRADVENLGLGPPTLAGPNGHLAWVLSAAQREDLLRRIEHEELRMLFPLPEGEG